MLYVFTAGMGRAEDGVDALPLLVPELSLLPLALVVVSFLLSYERFAPSSEWDEEDLVSSSLEGITSAFATPSSRSLLEPAKPSS